jgi:hypothetical protein
MDDYGLPDGGTVGWFGEDATCVQRSDAADPLRDFGMLSRTRLVPCPSGGASPTESALWVPDEPTGAKHRLLRRYVEASLPIVSKRERRLVLLEVLAGSGRDADAL